MRFLLFLFLIFGCISEAENEKPIIAVTSYPIYDYVTNIVDDEFVIWLMLPPGLNAHSYEPTPKDLVKLSGAEAFIYNNDYFEIWVSKTKKSVVNSNLLIISASEKIEFINIESTEIGSVDPHTWLSPKNAIIMVNTISEKLVAKYPAKKMEIEEKTKIYTEKLKELDKKYINTIEKCKQKDMFVSHAAFGYLANEYGLKQVPIVKGFDPQTEVSLADLEEVIKAAKEKNATHIFFEDFISPKLSETVAKEINGTTAVFSPMEAYSEMQMKNDSYIKVMERNLDVLKEALDCG